MGGGGYIWVCLCVRDYACEPYEEYNIMTVIIIFDVLVYTFLLIF